MPVMTNVSRALKNYWSWPKELYIANEHATIMLPELSKMEMTDRIEIGISFFGEESTNDS